MPEIQIKKHGRHWAVFLGGHLLGVVVYKKGARTIKAHLEELLAANETQPSLDEVAQWAAKDFHATMLSRSGLDLWTRLRQSDWNRALSIAAEKTGDDVYAWLAFSHLSIAEKKSILHHFAHEDLAAVTHWPIVSAILTDLARTPESFEAATVRDLVAAFPKLSTPQKAVVSRRLASILSSDTDDYVPSVLAAGAVLKDETLQLALKHTVGRIGFYSTRPKPDELNVTASALGATSSFTYFVTWDFETEPANGRPLQRLPWEFVEDGLPVPPSAKSISPKRIPQPPNALPSFDYLGCSGWDRKVGPHLVLRIGRIAAAAKELGVRFEALFAVAWIHQFAHLLHTAIPDDEGVFNPRLTRRSMLSVEIESISAASFLVNATFEAGRPMFLWSFSVMFRCNASWHHACRVTWEKRVQKIRGTDRFRIPPFFVLLLSV